MEYSSKYRIFLLLVSLIFVLNLLVMNDLTSIWNGAEATIVMAIQQVDTGFEAGNLPPLPMLLLTWIYESQGLNEFVLRLPNLILLLLAGFCFYGLAKKMFGASSSAMTLLIIASSFLIPSLAKMATADIWLMAAQLIAVLNLMLYLKQTRRQWLFGFYLAFFLGLLVEPMAMLWSMGSFVLALALLHPKAVAMKSLAFVLPALVLILAVSQIGAWSWNGDQSTLLGRLTWSEYLLALLFGMLPWLGFLPMALWDLLKKLRLREELAVVGFCWLLAGLVSQSALPQWILALLIGKHVMAFLDGKYPYAQWVLSFGMLNLVLSFFGVFFLLMSGYLQFSGVGFRSAMSVGAIYWVFAIIGAIGLLGKSKKALLGGICGSALLAYFLFWININPFMESSRGMSRQLVETADSLKTGAEMDALHLGITYPEKNTLSVYAWEKGFKKVVEMDGVPQSLPKDNRSIYILSATEHGNRVENFSSKQLKGRLQLFGDEQTLFIIGQ